jgi:hypothetical protein
MSISASTSTNRSVAVAFLIFLIVAGWYGSNVVGDLSSFNDWDKPAEIAKMWKGAVFGLIAFLLALGVDVKSLLGPFGAFLPGTTTTVTQASSTMTETKVSQDTPPAKE